MMGEEVSPHLYEVTTADEVSHRNRQDILQLSELQDTSSKERSRYPQMAIQHRHSGTPDRGQTECDIVSENPGNQTTGIPVGADRLQWNCLQDVTLHGFK